MYKKELYKLFNNLDALDVRTTTLEQRLEVHKLYEDLGGEVTIPTGKRTISNLNCHFYIQQYDNSNRCQLRAESIAEANYNFNFLPYETWIIRLKSLRYIDNSESSSKDTYLDKQLKSYKDE